MSAIDPSNFKSAKLIATEILAVNTGDPSSEQKPYNTFRQILTDSGGSESLRSYKEDPDFIISDEAAALLDKGKFLLSGLEKIKLSHPITPEENDAILSSVDIAKAFATEREAKAEFAKRSIRPKPGTPQANMRSLLRRLEVSEVEAKGKVSEGAEWVGDRDREDAVDMFTAFNIEAKAIRRTVIPLLLDLSQALERERGPDGLDGRR